MSDLTAAPAWRRWLLVAALFGVLLVRIVLSNQPDGSLQRVQQADVLVVAFDASYPPFETTDGQGSFGGFDAEMARLLAARLGVQVRFANVSFDSLYDALFSRQCDLAISALRYEAERTRDVIYSTPYFDAGQVIVIPAGSSIAKAGDLAGRRVGVEHASEGDVELEKLAAKLGGVDRRPFAAREEALAALRAGEVEAAVTDHVSALEMRREVPSLRLVLPPFAPDPLVIAGHHQDRTLMREIERILRALRDEGEIERLVAQTM